MIKPDLDDYFACVRLPSPTFVFHTVDEGCLTLEWCYGGGPGTSHWSVHVYWGADGVEAARTYGSIVDGQRVTMSDETNDWATVAKWLAEEPEGHYPAERELQHQMRRK